MGTRSVTVGDEWALLGPTPLEVEHHNTFGLLITCADELPDAPNYPAQRMRASTRTLDCPDCNVYARAVDGDVEVVVTPRAPIVGGLMATNLLTLDPASGDVMQENR